jgi:hypothetical protein
MGFAEKKVELLKIVADADEELTGKLIEFAKELNKSNFNFTKEELAKFHATRNKYLVSNNKTILLEDAHAYIRSLKQK